MKLKPFLIICGMLITLFLLSSCCTDPKIVYVDPDVSFYPNQPDSVDLVSDSYVNEYRLMVQDIRWRKRDTFIRWKLNIITEEKYQEIVAQLDQFLEKIDQQFEEYEQSLLD